MLDLPLEYALIGFTDAKPTGKIAPELLDLAKSAGSCASWTLSLSTRMKTALSLPSN